MIQKKAWLRHKNSSMLPRLAWRPYWKRDRPGSTKPDWFPEDIARRSMIPFSPMVWSCPTHGSLILRSPTAWTYGFMVGEKSSRSWIFSISGCIRKEPSPHRIPSFCISTDVTAMPINLPEKWTFLKPWIMSKKISPSMRTVSSSGVFPWGEPPVGNSPLITPGFGLQPHLEPVSQKPRNSSNSFKRRNSNLTGGKPACGISMMPRSMLKTSFIAPPSPTVERWIDKSRLRISWPATWSVRA